MFAEGLVPKHMINIYYILSTVKTFRTFDGKTFQRYYERHATDMPVMFSGVFRSETSERYISYLSRVFCVRSGVALYDPHCETVEI